MTSTLFTETGTETINGVFIQSSVAYQFPIALSKALELDHYMAPLPFDAISDTDTGATIHSLRRFGVTHIVASSGGPLLNKIEPFLEVPIVQYGPYSILSLKGSERSLVTPIDVPIVGYRDQSGTMPFRLIEYFLFEHSELRDRVEIVESLVMVNGDHDEAAHIARERPDLKVVAMNFVRSFSMDHYKVQYNFHRGTESYAEARPYLNHVFQTKLKGFLEPVLLDNKSQASETRNIELKWSHANQEFDLGGLQPGAFVRINYSYFPYWGSPDGVLYRGGSERMVFLPKGETAHFAYSRWRGESSWWGVGLSAVCVALLFFL
jgi:hypothetical protein